MTGRKGQIHYSIETKLEAIRLYEEEGLSQPEITKRLKLRDRGRVQVWLRQYRKEGKAAFLKPKGRPRKKPEDLESEVKRLRMEVFLLKKYHAELRKLERAERNIG
jgi:transposase-like protein